MAFFSMVILSLFQPVCGQESNSTFFSDVAFLLVASACMKEKKQFIKDVTLGYPWLIINLWEAMV